MGAQIVPALIGHGRAGRAMLKALSLLRIEHPTLGIADPVILPRDLSVATTRVRELARDGHRVLGLIANPHGLHASALLALHEAGIERALVEKPAAISAEQVAALRAVHMPVAIAHGYRMQWGVRKLRELIGSSRVFSIEGKYWQSSAAVARGFAKKSWKDDPALGGSNDALLDLGTHYLDLCAYLLGAVEWKGDAHLHYVNAQSEHRDTHVQLSLGTPTGTRITGSISKTVHGAGNELEIHVLTDRNALSWNFSDPDRVIVGENSSRRIVARTDANASSGLAPFHGAGWIEGYAEIFAELLRDGQNANYPTLAQHLDLLENLFTRVNLIRA